MSEQHGRPTNTRLARWATLRPSRPQWVGLAIVLAAAALMSACTGGSHTSPDPSGSLFSAPVPAGRTTDLWGYDTWTSYRSKPSYVGTLESRLDPAKTYYVPNNVGLAHTGNNEWFALWPNAPIMASAKDAGNYPFKLTVATEAPAYMYPGGAGLVITLPTRVDFTLQVGSADGPHWIKTLPRPYYDTRSPNTYHVAMVPITQVLPAPGHTLDDYYMGTSLTALPQGHNAYVDIGFARIVADTNQAWIQDYGYIERISPNSRSGYLKVTRTAAGLSLCTNNPERRGYQLNVVPRGFEPQKANLMATVVSGC